MAIQCKNSSIGANCKFGERVLIECDELYIGPRTVIGDDCTITGRKISIGAECWLGNHVEIGGGSCQDAYSELVMGDLCHVGDHAFINTARKVAIGDEVGIGMHTKLFTHGAYLSELDGFPVKFAPIQIGSRVWIPQATVLPGVTIGNDCVVAAGSVVGGPLPSGCLAGGAPAKIIRENAYPANLTLEEKKAKLGRLLEDFRAICADRGFGFDLAPSARGFVLNGIVICLAGQAPSAGEAVFDIASKRIEGKASGFSELLKNELRRHGIRFRSYQDSGKYVSW
ncbi:MAG: acyltransferase [Pseudomonadota bacterium]